MKHLPGCGTTYMEDCECADLVATKVPRASPFLVGCIKRCEELHAENEKLRAACNSAITWLDGWASAEPFLSILREAVVKPNTEVSGARREEN